MALGQAERNLGQDLGRSAVTDPRRLDAAIRAHIERILEECEGRKLQAAKVLGIGRTTLYRYLKKWSLK